MTYKPLPIDPEDLLDNNFLFPIYSDELSKTHDGYNTLHQIKKTLQKGSYVSQGSLWSRVEHVEDNGSGQEIELSLGSPKNQLRMKKIVKGSWTFYLRSSAVPGQKNADSYSLFLCENLEKLPYDLTAFYPKSHGIEYLGYDERYALGPDSRLTLFVSHRNSKAVQFAATMPEWEHEIKRMLSSTTAVQRAYLADDWLITNFWSEGVMLTCPRILTLYSE